MSEKSFGHLRYDLIGAWEAGIRTHPLKRVAELGILFAHAVPQSIADQWHLWNCEWECALPDYITTMEADPMDFVGYGLSEEKAIEIAAGARRQA